MPSKLCQEWHVDSDVLSDMFRVTCQGGHVESEMSGVPCQEWHVKSKYVESDMSSDMSRVRYCEWHVKCD